MDESGEEEVLGQVAKELVDNSEEKEVEGQKEVEGV